MNAKNKAFYNLLADTAAKARKNGKFYGLDGRAMPYNVGLIVPHGHDKGAIFFDLVFCVLLDLEHENKFCLNWFRKRRVKLIFQNKANTFGLLLKTWVKSALAWDTRCFIGFDGDDFFAGYYLQNAD